MGWSNNHPNGLIHYAPHQAYRGYTLVTNLNSHESRLIDMQGRVCHTWSCNRGISYAYLLPNGNLLLRTGPAGQEVSFQEHPALELLPRGGRTASGAILELDWDSNVVWEYRYPLLHHDFERLPNGNTLVLAWELIPEEISQQVQGGLDEGEGRGMLGDVVREITTAGDVVYEWISWDHLDPDVDRIGFPEGAGGMDTPERPQRYARRGLAGQFPADRYGRYRRQVQRRVPLEVGARQHLPPASPDDAGQRERASLRQRAAQAGFHPLTGD